MDAVLRLLDQIDASQIDEICRQGQRRQAQRAICHQPGRNAQSPFVLIRHVAVLILGALYGSDVYQVRKGGLKMCFSQSWYRAGSSCRNRATTHGRLEPSDRKPSALRWPAPACRPDADRVTLRGLPCAGTMPCPDLPTPDPVENRPRPGTSSYLTHSVPPERETD